MFVLYHMGFLFGDDKEDDETVDELPDSYYIENGVIYDSTGNQLSLSYHDFDFPKARLGAVWYELVEQNGFFIPRNRPNKTWERSLDEAIRGTGLPKGFLEAVHDLHGPCPEHIKNDHDLESRIRKFGGEEMYGGESIDMHDDFVGRDKPREIIENTAEKAENESLDISVDSEKLVVLVKAYVSDVVVEGSQDWIYLSSAYDNLFHVLNEYVSKEKPVESLRHAESMMDIWVPPEEYEKIRECSKLSKETDSDRRLNKVEQELERELY